MTHFTNWVIAHAHMGVLGFSGHHRARGHLLHPAPDHRPAALQPRLADIQYWLVLIGMTGFFVVLTAAGLIQGTAGSTGRRSTGCSRRSTSTWCCGPRFGVLIVGAAVIGLYNILQEPLRRAEERRMTS